MNTVKFNPRELCNRKLWQLVSSEIDHQANEMELREAIAELAERRHYMEQLQQIGAIEEQRAGA
jgi:hypothetical protein